MEKTNRSDYTVIIGCGRLGAALANAISERGGDVLIIDRSRDAFRKLSPSFGGLAITGDASDLDVLSEARIAEANAAVAVTDNDNVNIMAALMARELFRVRRVVARLYDPDRECVCREFGIDTICPAVLSAQEIGGLLTGAREGERK